MRHEFPDEENPLAAATKKIAEVTQSTTDELPWQGGDNFSHENTMISSPHKSDAWHTIKVVLVVAIVFAFFSYLAYLGKGN
jgi:hypothetical protein